MANKKKNSKPKNKKNTATKKTKHTVKRSSSSGAKKSTAKSRVKVRDEQQAHKTPRMNTAEFREPATKEKGKPFDPTTAPRAEEDQAQDVSQDMQEQTITAPREGVEKEDSTAGTA